MKQETPEKTWNGIFLYQSKDMVNHNVKLINGMVLLHQGKIITKKIF